MARIVRAALTQTVNAFREMPATVEALEGLGSKLESVRAANVEHHVDLIEQAAGRGAGVVGLGELFTAPYFALERRALWRALAESAVDGPTVTRLRAVAREHGVVLVAPIYERDGERFFNTAVCIDADGALLGRYRKTHIPQGSNERGSFDERFYYQESDGAPQPSQAEARMCPQSRNPFFPVFATAVGNVGVAICFDRHFEGVVAALAEGGAELVFSPAVTFGEKSQRLWRHEFQTDATRHHLFIGGSNRAGAEAPWGTTYFGQSHFVGPNGPCADQSDHPQLIIADLDLGALTQDDPAGWDLRQNRRAAIYSKER